MLAIVIMMTGHELFPRWGKVVRRESVGHSAEQNSVCTAEIPCLSHGVK